MQAGKKRTEPFGSGGALTFSYFHRCDSLLRDQNRQRGLLRRAGSAAQPEGERADAVTAAAGLWSWRLPGEELGDDAPAVADAGDELDGADGADGARGARHGDQPALSYLSRRGARLGSVRDRVRRAAPQDPSRRCHQSDRQASLPHQAGGAAEERSRHPAKPPESRRRQSRADVRDARADLRGDGEAERRHAGDDSVDWPAERARHEIPHHADPRRAEASAQPEHRALRPEAGERSAELRRGIPASETL